MTNIRFLIYSIIFSATMHLSVIYFLNTEKKDSEVYTHLRELLDKLFPKAGWLSEQSYTNKEKGVRELKRVIHNLLLRYCPF